MVTAKRRWLPLAFCLFCVFAHAQEAKLEPGKPIEREIAGGESHTYQITLTTGQFIRFRLQQRTIDAALILTAPDGKQPVEMNLTGMGEEESLSLEALIPGLYRLTVRGEGAARGLYRLDSTIRAAATPQDRKRVAAEAVLVDARELRKQAGKTAQQVIEKTQQTLPIWRELGEPHWTAYSLLLIGSSYHDLSRYDKATEYYEQVLTIYREVKNRRGEGNVLTNSGRAFRDMGHPEKAIEYCGQALVINREVGNRVGEAGALNILGRANADLGRAEKAIEYLEQALAIYGEIKNRVGEANALNNMGILYRDLGRTEKAIEYFDRTLAIAREVKNRSLEGDSLILLGRASAILGRAEKTIEYYEQALAIYREIKNRFGEGNALNNLGIVYKDLGRYDKTIGYYTQALAIYREIKNKPGEGNALLNLAVSFKNLDRLDKSIEYSEQALAIFREINNKLGEGHTLSNLGAVYYSLNHHEKAIEYFDQSLAIYREIKNRANQGLVLYRLGIVSRNLNDIERAVKYHEESLLIAREVKAQPSAVESLKELAEDEASRGNLVRARALIEEGLGIAESLRSDVVNTDSRAAFLATVQSSYQLYTDVLMRQHQAEPTKGFDALAVEVSERQRARSLLDLLSEARADVRQGVDATLLDRERSLGRQLNDKAQRLTQANKPEQSAALKQEISQLENDYERAQSEIRKASPHYAALTQPQPLKLNEIQQQLDADTLLLEYALGEERSYLWAITKDSLSSYELPKREQIKQSALQVYELLTARSTTKRGESAPQRQQRITQAEANLPSAAKSLSQMLLGPVVAQLGNKRLVIVADGALQYIPFAMLPEAVVGGQGPGVGRNQPLIVNHEIVSLPSASVLAIQRAEIAGRQLAPKMLAVIADPVFDRTDERFKTLATNVSDKPQTVSADDARSIEHLAEKSDDKSVTTRRLVIPRLPYTRQEANQLMALAPKTSSLSAMDFQASRATVLSGDLSQYRYVHFATHGLLDSERPGLSSLVLSMVDAEGKPQDGFLRANDIYNLKLPAELVVLSACQTGLGKEIKGEGLVGLTRGFMYAGAARVVVSLWSVNDKATADLMTKFYEKMLKQGERPAAALRAAQVEMWKQKQWQSPYYWAAFTMQGEWR